MDLSQSRPTDAGGLYDGSKQLTFQKVQRACADELKRQARDLRRQLQSRRPSNEAGAAGAPARAGPWSHLRGLSQSSQAVVRQHAGHSTEDRRAHKEASDLAASMRRDAIVAAPRWRAVAVVHHASATGNHIASAIPSDARALEALAAARIGIWAPGRGTGAGRTRVGAGGGACVRSGWAQRETRQWGLQRPAPGYSVIIGAENDGIVLVRPWWEGGDDPQRDSASREVASLSRWVTPPAMMAAAAGRAAGSGARGGPGRGGEGKPEGWRTLPWGQRPSEILQRARSGDVKAPRAGFFAWQPWE
jgi:hypothetical protein